MANESERIEREMYIDASPETVYGFFTDPQKLVQWKGMRALLEAKPGGVFRVDIDGEHVARGNFVELVPFSKVVFTWGWERGAPLPPGATTVTVTLTPEGRGTRLRLVHEGLPPPAVEHHTQGWEFYLPRLRIAASGRGNESNQP